MGSNTPRTLYTAPVRKAQPKAYREKTNCIKSEKNRNVRVTTKNMREKERKREVFIGCRCAFFLLFLSVSSLFFGGHWIQFNQFLRLFSQSERQRANESETPETRNLRRATKEHLPLAERNKERKKDRRRCSHHRLKNVLKTYRHVLDVFQRRHERA